MLGLVGGIFQLIGMTFIHTPEQLGQALRSARKQLALTQPQLALAAGVGVRFVVELEAGKPTVRLVQVLRVIDAVGGTLRVTGLAGAQERPGACARWWASAA